MKALARKPKRKEARRVVFLVVVFYTQKSQHPNPPSQSKNQTKEPCPSQKHPSRKKTRLMTHQKDTMPSQSNRDRVREKSNISPDPQMLRGTINSTRSKLS